MSDGKTERTAACYCAQLNVTIEGNPALHGLCHCLQCQQMSGGAFTYSGYWPKLAVRKIAGNATRYRKTSESGRWLEWYFCPVCGGRVYWYLALSDQLIGLPIGSLADPKFPSPVYSLWHGSKHDWVDVPAASATFERQPQSEAEFAPLMQTS